MAEWVMRVLVVDPDEELARIMVEVLRGDDHDARTAATGEQALALSRASPPDVAFIAARVADMDAATLALRLRSAGGERVPWIIGVGVAVAAGQTDAFDAWVEKPLRWPEVTAAVDAARQRVADAAILSVVRTPLVSAWVAYVRSADGARSPVGLIIAATPDTAATIIRSRIAQRGTAEAFDVDVAPAHECPAHDIVAAIRSDTHPGRARG